MAQYSDAAGSRLENPGDGKTAVDGDDLAGDVRRGGHAEEGGERRNLLRLADPPRRRARQDLLQPRRIVEYRLGERRADVPRRDRVDANVVARPLRGERAREVRDRGLGHGVGRAGAEVAEGGDGDDVDDGGV